MAAMSEILTLFVMIGSRHGRAYTQLFAVLVIFFGVKVLYDAYQGVWRAGGIGWRGELKKAQWYDRILLVLVAVSCLYLGSGLLSGISSLPFVGPTPPAIVNTFSAVLALVLAGITLFGAYRVWKTGMVGFREEPVEAAWYYKALLPALGFFFTIAAWLFIRRL